MLNSSPNKARFHGILAVITLLVVSVFLIAGCSNSSTPAASPTQAAAPTTAPETATPNASTASTAMTATESTTATGAITATEATTATGATTATNAAAGPTVMVADNAKLGKILVDANGMTLYVFDKDSQDTSACSGACATKWPPLTVSSESDTPTAGEGVTGTLAVMTRDDGSYQVTINGMPLYHYAQDAQVGDTNGQGFGEIWWVVGPDGTKITTK